MNLIKSIESLLKKKNNNNNNNDKNDIPFAIEYEDQANEDEFNQQAINHWQNEEKNNDMNKKSNDEKKLEKDEKDEKDENEEKKVIQYIQYKGEQQIIYTIINRLQILFAENLTAEEINNYVQTTSLEKAMRLFLRIDYWPYDSLNEALNDNVHAKEIELKLFHQRIWDGINNYRNSNPCQLSILKCLCLMPRESLDNLFNVGRVDALGSQFIEYLKKDWLTPENVNNIILSRKFENFIINIMKKTDGLSEEQKKSMVQNFVNQFGKPVINPPDSTHTTSVHDSTSQSAHHLKKAYEDRLEKKIDYQLEIIKQTIENYKFSNSTINEENDNINQLRAKALAVIKKILVNDTYRGHVDKASGIGVLQLMGLIYHAIQDKDLRIGDYEDALVAWLKGICDINDEDNASQLICAPGAFNKLIESLVGYHPYFNLIFINPELIGYKVKATVIQTVSEYLEKQDKEKLSVTINSLSKDGVVAIWSKIETTVLQRVINKFEAQDNPNLVKMITEVTMASGVDVSIDHVLKDYNYNNQEDNYQVPEGISTSTIKFN